MIRARGAPIAGAFHVQRWTRLSIASAVVSVAVIVVLAIVPFLFGSDVTQQLTVLLTFVILAVMWNALAGYGGLISVGQQAFIGLGAYGTIFLTQHGFTPYLAMIVAGIGAGAVAIPVSFIMLRLRGGQFAIGMWVVAEVFGILVSLDQSLGGGTGVSLVGLNTYAPGYRQAYTFWLTLACATVLLGLVFFLLRRRIGTSLQAVRDDEEAAASLGVNVGRSKRVLFIVAAVGCGIAGSLYLANTLFIQTDSVFGVQWTAYMLFMVLVGGLGTFEGPILGAVIFYLIQAQFGNSGAWYFVGLGAVAIAFALFLPNGIWGAIDRRLRLRLLPVGYTLRSRETAAPAEPAATTDEG
ncbi:MAG TPA: branched-chain amino acid ABC transporter permease [Candidatus Dormibacteraeota bacterium]